MRAESWRGFAAGWAVKDRQECSRAGKGWSTPTLRNGKRERTYDLPMASLEVQMSRGGGLEARRRTEKVACRQAVVGKKLEVGAAKRVWRRGNVMCRADDGRAGSAEDRRGYENGRRAIRNLGPSERDRNCRWCYVTEAEGFKSYGAVTARDKSVPTEFPRACSSSCHNRAPNPTALKEGRPPRPVKACGADSSLCARPACLVHSLLRRESSHPEPRYWRLSPRLHS
jgi:hypothetical protein